MLRRKLLPVHRWVGLTVGLIALASAVTGAGMIFRQQLDPIVYPRIFRSTACAQALPLDAFAETARRLHRAGQLDYLRVRGKSDAPIQARFVDKDTLYFDRCTGALVASQNRYSGFFGTLEEIHRGRWLPSAVSDVVMGSGALSLLFLLIGIGTYLWWPRKPRRFSQGFQVSRKLKGPAFNIGLHRAVGGWVAIPLALSALTGLPNAFAGIHDAITSLDAVAGVHPHSAFSAAVPAHRLPLARAWETITRLTPAPREALLHVGLKPTDPLEIYIIAADAPHANARTYLFLDAYSGRVLSYTPYANMGVGSRIYFWMLSLHTGEVGGVFAQLVLFAGAAGATVLGYTGYSTYLRRRFLKKKSRSTTKAGKPQGFPMTAHPGLPE